MNAGTLEIFSPQNFHDYVGQNKAKKIAEIMTTAARIQSRPVPNLLVTGRYGVGKSTLAKVIRNEAHEPIHIIDAAAFNKALPSFSRPLIVDEIHNLDPTVADSLNVIMDQGRVRIIGCTNNPGLLPAAFRSRFRTIDLEDYTLGDIKIIVDHIASRKSVGIDSKTVTDIAKRSRLNPRAAINNLAFIFDYMTVRGLSVVPSRLAQEAFDALGIDPNGFNDRDYSYMKVLSDDTPMGVNNISAVLGIDAKTIEAEIEPYLLQTGHIARMPRGRIKLKEL